MPQPPACPYCPTHPLLWKDTTLTSLGCPGRWKWHCTGCKGQWEPTHEQKQRYA